VIGEDEEEVDDAGRGDDAACLSIGGRVRKRGGGYVDDCVVLTALARSSAGVTGMFVVASSLRLQALRMFFILGAS